MIVNKEVRGMTASKQINNLRIKHSDFYSKYQVITLDGKVLEEFDRWESAVKFCQETRDFIISK